MNPWIGVDLDGTLAHFDEEEWKGLSHIGKPIPAMIERVKKWLSQGKEVKIFTARASHGESAKKFIRRWCKKHLGRELEVTNQKDFAMIELWDDRCVQVKPNTGEPVR
jgi:hypothetical protein